MTGPRAALAPIAGLLDDAAVANVGGGLSIARDHAEVALAHVRDAMGEVNRHLAIGQLDAVEKFAEALLYLDAMLGLLRATPGQKEFAKRCGQAQRSLALTLESAEGIEFHAFPMEPR
jgi:hypothetical protein